ncbi:MAG: hypothetical protein LBQ63_01565 [Deltaproteobacteria bacterium]|nr:hypothetical protein [Deltaproteobacteria bacterium]
MAIIYQLDKRIGITYAYESTAVWDKEKKQSRARRTLIGKLDAEPGIKEMQMTKSGQGKGGIGHNRNRVGDDDLFIESQKKAVHPEREQFPVRPARGKGVFYLGIADYRPRDQMGEHAKIGEKVERRLCRLNLAAVDIYNIADGVEGEKADSEGQRRPFFHQGGQDERKHPIRVLEPDQNGQIDDHKKRRAKTRLPASGQTAPSGIVEGAEGKQQKDVGRLAPGVKKQADEKHGAVAQDRGLDEPGGGVDTQKNGQNQKNKGQRGKNHMLPGGCGVNRVSVLACPRPAMRQTQKRPCFQKENRADKISRAVPAEGEERAL